MATNESPVTCSRPRSLLEFPNEILERIVVHLSGPAKAAVSATSPRLEEVTRHHTQYMKIPWLSSQIFKFMSGDIATVRWLDLSNCHSSSRSLRSLIIKCPELEMLNVVNSGLSFLHLVDLLDLLRDLRVLSFSMMNFQPYAAMEFKFNKYFSLRIVYIEYASCEGLCGLVIQLLNACVNLTKVHINVIGLRSPFSSEYALNNVIDSRIWRSLDTFILFCDLSMARSSVTLLERFFFHSPRKPNFIEWSELGTGCYVYEHGVFNTMHFLNYKPDARVHVLPQVARHRISLVKLKTAPYFWIPQRGMTIDFPYRTNWPRLDSFLNIPQQWPSSLVELDLSQCHFWVPKRFWNNLATCSPQIKALAIPTCALVPAEYWKSATSWDNARASSPVEPVGRDDCRVISGLRGLKLRTFRLGCKRHFEIYVCDKCRTLVHAGNLGSLDQLPHLNELTFYRVTAHPSLFEKLANKHVHTVRLCLEGRPGTQGLESFIQQCPVLERLKLENANLDLSCPFLWTALSQCRHLRELCLSTDSTDAVDMELLFKYLPGICQELKVLHIHARYARNRTQLQTDVGNLVRKHNAKFGYKRLHFTYTSSPSLSFINNKRVPGSYPGRGLCCAANFIAKIKPVGWELQSSLR